MRQISKPIHYGTEMEFVLRHIWSKDTATYQHCENVHILVAVLCEELKLTAVERKVYTETGRIHDVGKVLIDSNILKKPGKLEPREFTEIQKHAVLGYEYLRACDPFEEHALITLHHHERWDGTGYPSGLYKENIPLGSRIIAIADSFDAMTGIRPYRRPFSTEEALHELEGHAGTQFDPDLVRYFIRSVKNSMPELG